MNRHIPRASFQVLFRKERKTRIRDTILSICLAEASHFTSSSNRGRLSSSNNDRLLGQKSYTDLLRCPAKLALFREL